MLITNKLYNFLKWFTTIFLPAVGALYFGLAQIWDFDRIVGVNGTINAIITFLGILLNISSRKYSKVVNTPDGDLIINEVDGEKFPMLGVNGSLEAMTSKRKVILQVVDQTNLPKKTTPHIPE